MESTFGNGSFNGTCRGPGVNLAADGKTRLLTSFEGTACWSGAVLSVDDGVGRAGRAGRSADDVSGTWFASAGSVANGTAGLGAWGGPAGTCGVVLDPFLTDRTVDTGFDSFFTAGGCRTGLSSPLVAEGGGTCFGAALTDACAGRAGAVRCATGIGQAGEIVNTFQYE